MSRNARIIMMALVLFFTLACGAITQPFQDAQNAVETVQSMATAMPFETFQSFATNIPAFTQDPGSSDDPQGEPVSDWNGIPVHPAAYAGDETSGLYTYKANATVKEVYDYYATEMVNLGWSDLFSIPDTGSGALLTYEKDSHTVTVTITSDSTDVVLVFLSYQ